MILAAVPLCLRAAPASAGAPEPLDAEFLDYLLAMEGKGHNWTVVADEKPVKKPAKADTAQKPAAPAKPKEEAKP
jgi:hypothetical protein